MDKVSSYRDRIAKIKRLAQIIPNMHSIIFEPGSDGHSFNMFWHVQSMNEKVQLGVLVIPKDFMTFLKSGWAPKEAWGPENAYYYLQEHVLDIDRQTSEKSYATISNNLKILQSGDQNAINNFINTGVAKVPLNTVVDTDNRTRNQAHNAFIARYQQWKKSNAGPGVSKAIPYMASRKRSLQSISFRKKQETK